MKLRMYLRGLGLGLFVAAIVLSFNNNNKETLTDSEIIAKAKQLGMEEKKQTLSEELKKPEEAEEASKDAANGSKPAGDGNMSVAEADKKAEAQPGKEEVKKEEVKEENIKEEAKTEQKKAEENKTEEKSHVKKTSKTTITIVSGVSSETVAKLLEKGGVIDSASKFDKYLCDKDYDNRIATGTYEIPEGATYEEIAKLITNR